MPPEQKVVGSNPTGRTNFSTRSTFALRLFASGKQFYSAALASRHARLRAPVRNLIRADLAIFVGPTLLNWGLRLLVQLRLNYSAPTRDDEPPGVIARAVYEWILTLDNLEPLFTEILFNGTARSLVAGNDLPQQFCTPGRWTSIDNHESAS